MCSPWLEELEGQTLCGDCTGWRSDQGSPKAHPPYPEFVYRPRLRAVRFCCWRTRWLIGRAMNCARSHLDECCHHYLKSLCVVVATWTGKCEGFLQQASGNLTCVHQLFNEEPRLKRHQRDSN